MNNLERYLLHHSFVFPPWISDLIIRSSFTVSSNREKKKHDIIPIQTGPQLLITPNCPRKYAATTHYTEPRISFIYSFRAISSLWIYAINSFVYDNFVTITPTFLLQCEKKEAWRHYPPPSLSLICPGQEVMKEARGKQVEKQAVRHASR